MKIYFASSRGCIDYKPGDVLCDIETGHVSRVVFDGRGGCLKPARDANVCDQCGEIVFDLDAGFSPAVHEMSCECGGKWRRPATGDEAGFVIAGRANKETRR